MKFLIVFLALSSVAAVTHGQSLSQVLKMAQYANKLSQVPGVGNVMGSMLSNSGGLTSAIISTEENSNIVVRILSRVAKVMAKIVIKNLIVIDNLLNSIRQTIENIIGFIVGLPSTIYNIVRTNYYLLYESMDRHGLTLQGLIRTIEYTFFGTQSSYASAYSPGYVQNQPSYASVYNSGYGGITGQMGQGISTIPMAPGEYVQVSQMG